MQDSDVAKQIARWVALGALFLIPLTPLIVVDTFFFPFITGKAFFFRIVIEIAVCAWVALAFLDKEYRPRFSWIGAAVVAFVAWMFVADLFALNVSKAIWSNFERMEGWMLLIHLLGFFFASSAVLRVEKKWRTWFFWSILVSLYIVGYSLLQLGGSLEIHQGSSRIDATLGNSAYLAIYFLFNVFIALWLALTEEQPWLKWSLIAVSAVEGILIFFTETRGAILGLIGALCLAALLAAVTAGKRVRRGAAGALVLLLLVVGGFYAARNSAFVQGNHTLQRIASISLADGQTRFTIWRMAFRGIQERPVVGWGQEGFNYVFNTYYDPSLYGQESWFDRAHNAFIDWLSAGGIPAFVLYLSLFGTAIALLWRSSGLSRPERIVLTAALVGYACHNLFVFDNLYSYIYFFSILALIDSQIGKPTALERASEISPEDGTSYVLLVAVMCAGALVWFINIPGMRASTELIAAMSSPAGGDPATNIAAFEDLLRHPAFASQEIREQLVSFATAALQSASVPDAQKQQVAALAIAEMQKQIAAYPEDAREHLQLAYVYRAAGATQEALKEIQIAKRLSPNKEDMWIEAGVAEWDAGNVKEAQANFNKAYELAPQHANLATYAAAGNIAVGNKAGADKILISAFGTTAVDSDVLAMAYYRTNDWPSLIELWKMRAKKPDANFQTHFSLAAAYYAAGEYVTAIKTVNAAVALFPSMAPAGDAAIKQIREKMNGQ